MSTPDRLIDGSDVLGESTAPPAKTQVTTDLSPEKNGTALKTGVATVEGHKGEPVSAKVIKHMAGRLVYLAEQGPEESAEALARGFSNNIKSLNGTLSSAGFEGIKDDGGDWLVIRGIHSTKEPGQILGVLINISGTPGNFFRVRPVEEIDEFSKRQAGRNGTGVPEKVPALAGIR